VTVDVVAIGAHPDDVELGCGATLALMAANGRSAAIVHLSSGEAGSRGTPEERRREAARAAEALGVAAPEFLDCGDGALRTGREEEDRLIEVLRRLRPRLVLGPPPSDRHPDHGRAHALVRAACFYSGLAKRWPGPGAAPHRPPAMYCYLQHDLVVPSFVVDVTASWPRKMAALDAYASQLWRPDSSSSGAGREHDSGGSVPSGVAPPGPATLVSSPEFRLAVEGRARDLGLLVGATFGEGFLALGPLAVADPLELVPQGLR